MPALATERMYSVMHGRQNRWPHGVRTRPLEPAAGSGARQLSSWRPPWFDTMMPRQFGWAAASAAESPRSTPFTTIGSFVRVPIQVSSSSVSDWSYSFET